MIDIRVTSGINGEFGFKLVERGGQDLRVFVLNNTGRISVWDESRDRSDYAVDHNPAVDFLAE